MESEITQAAGLGRAAARGHHLRRYQRILPPEFARITLLLDNVGSADAAGVRGRVCEVGAATSSYLAQAAPDRTRRVDLAFALELLSAASLAFDPDGRRNIRCWVTGLVDEVEVFLAIDGELAAAASADAEAEAEAGREPVPAPSPTTTA